MELLGKIPVVLGEKELSVGEYTIPVPTNPHNFYVAGAFCFYGLSTQNGEKPPRAKFVHKGLTLVLYQVEGNAILGLFGKVGKEKKLHRFLRKDELALFLEWIKSYVRGVAVDDMVFAKLGQSVYVGGLLELSPASQRRLFLSLELSLKEGKKRVVELPEGRVVLDSKNVLFFARNIEGKLMPVGRIKAEPINILRLMSIL
ncbi:MAG: hypothetical protein ACK42C_00035 [Aquificaceae bacterium]